MFDNLGQISGVEGITNQLFSNILGTLTKPPFIFDSEKLEYVMWAHGSSLAIEHPKRYARIERKGMGTRIVANVHGENGFNSSWVHFAIPTPAFALGKRFSIRSVILNYKTSNPPFGPKGTPLAAVQEVQVWDGHVRIATENVQISINPEQRFRKIGVSNSHNVQWGIGVSLNIILLSPTPISGSRWIEIASIGVELVTRSGVVLALPVL